MKRKKPTLQTISLEQFNEILEAAGSPKKCRSKVDAPPQLTGAEFCQKQNPVDSAETQACTVWDWLQWSGKKGERFLGLELANLVDPETGAVLVDPGTFNDPGSTATGSKISRPATSQMQVNHNGFLFQVKETKTDWIKEVYTCWNSRDAAGTDEWELCATVVTDLKISKDLNDWCSVKLENKFCYMPLQDLRRFIECLNNELDIEFRHFTRLDAAVDFQRTDYRNVSAQRFMEKCRKGDYVFARKKYDSKSSKRSHKNLRYSVVAGLVGVVPAGKLKAANPMADKYEIEEIDFKGRLSSVETLRWGKRQSGLSVQMYNKSLHMRTVENKPWIAQHWKDAKLVEGFEVYRIEFSHMKDVNDIVIEDETGNEVRRLSHSNLDIILHLEEYFKALYKKHFHVAIYEPGVRFSRLKKVELLNMNKPFFTVQRSCEKQKSNNYVKNAIRMTMEDAAELSQGTPVEKIMASELYRYAARQIEKFDLSKWKDKHFPDVSFDESSMSYFDQVHTNELRHLYFIKGEQERRMSEDSRFTVMSALIGLRRTKVLQDLRSCNGSVTNTTFTQPEIFN